MMVDERVPDARVLLNVVVDAGRVESGGDLDRRTAQGAVPRAIAGHDRAGPLQRGGHVLRHHPVVDARGPEPGLAGGISPRIPRTSRTSREQQREAAAHAEADHADLARAVVPVREPGPARLGVGEDLALPGGQERKTEIRSGLGPMEYRSGARAR